MFKDKDSIELQRAVVDFDVTKINQLDSCDLTVNELLEQCDRLPESDAVILAKLHKVAEGKLKIKTTALLEGICAKAPIESKLWKTSSAKNIG